MHLIRTASSVLLSVRDVRKIMRRQIYFRHYSFNTHIFCDVREQALHQFEISNKIMEEQRQLIQKYKKCGRQQNYKNLNDIQRERNKNIGTAKRMLEEPFGDVREFLACSVNYIDRVVYNIRMKLKIRRRINSGSRCFYGM